MPLKKREATEIILELRARVVRSCYVEKEETGAEVRAWEADRGAGTVLAVRCEHRDEYPLSKFMQQLEENYEGIGDEVREIAADAEAADDPN